MAHLRITDAAGFASISVSNKQSLTFAESVVGRRKWNKQGILEFEPTQSNVDLFHSLFPDAIIRDERREQPSTRTPRGTFSPRQFGGVSGQLITTYPSQTECFEKCKDREYFALFSEPGTGKTKIAIDKIARHWLLGQIDGVLLIAENLIHHQWVKEQIPEYMPDNVPWNAMVYAGKTPDKWTFKEGCLAILTINYEAMNTPSGKYTTNKFIDEFRRVIIVLDESHMIKNVKAKRTQAIYQLRDKVQYRLIMSGTPIAKNLEDEWSQLRFLSDDILRHTTLTSFRSEYSQMVSVSGSSWRKFVVGSRNVEKFKSLTDPHIYRALKKDVLELPEPVRRRWHYNASEEQHRLCDEITKKYMAEIKGQQSRVMIQSAITASIRKQQIISGFVVDEDNNIHELENTRMKALLDLIETHAKEETKICIWAAFQYDIEQLEKTLESAFPGSTVTLTGKTSKRCRSDVVKRFMTPDNGVRFLLANTQVGGSGLNLQGECCTVIYYTTTMRWIERKQSEDRFHRIGTTKTVTYWDIMSDTKVCRKIMLNLNKKRSFSSMVLDVAGDDADV